GDTLIVVPTGGREHDWRVQLEYTGTRAFTTPFGDTVAAGTPWRFGWERFEPQAAWHLEFRSIGAEPFLPDVPVVATMDTTRLDLTWYRPPRPEIPQASIRTTARGTVTLSPG